MYIVALKVERTYFFVWPLHWQHSPATLVALYLAHVALQEPLVVAESELSPYVGSMATRLPVTC